MLNKLTDKLRDFKIVEKSKIWYSISGAIIAIGLIVILIFNLNLGIDFTGGTVVKVDGGSFIATSVNKEKRDEVSEFCRNIFDEHGLNVETEQYSSTVDSGAIEYKFQQKIDGSKVGATEFNERVDRVVTALETRLAAEYPGETVNFAITYQTITGSASRALIGNTFLALGIAIVLILIYIVFRFTPSSALAAVCALLHDVLIMVALTAVFRVQVNASFIAAVLTIVGYSINATIIIFDKVRENLKNSKYENASKEEIINASIRGTFTRTVNTTITTLMTITMLAVLGVPAVREFAVPIIFGLLAGTYSSLVISGSLWVVFQKLGDKIKAKYKKSYKAKKAKKQSESA